MKSRNKLPQDGVNATSRSLTNAQIAAVQKACDNVSPTIKLQRRRTHKTDLVSALQETGTLDLFQSIDSKEEEVKVSVREALMLLDKDLKVDLHL